MTERSLRRSRFLLRYVVGVDDRLWGDGGDNGCSVYVVVMYRLVSTLIYWCLYRGGTCTRSAALIK